LAGSDAITDWLLEKEPAKSRLSGLPTLLRLPLTVALAVGRFVGSACLLALRLTIAFGITAVVLLFLVNVALGGVSKDNFGAVDPRPYLQGAFHLNADWSDNVQKIEQQMADISSASVPSPAGSGTEGDITTTKLVDTVSQLLPPEQRSLYQEMLPLLGRYDTMLGDLQSALARRNVDDMFRDLQPWLDMAEKDAARYQTPYTD